MAKASVSSEAASPVSSKSRATRELLGCGALLVVISMFQTWATLAGGVSNPPSRLRMDSFQLLGLTSTANSNGSMSLHYVSIAWYTNCGALLSVGAILILGSAVIEVKGQNRGIRYLLRLTPSVVGIVIVVFESLTVAAPSSTVDTFGILGPGHWIAFAGSCVALCGVIAQIVVQPKSISIVQDPRGNRNHVEVGS